MGASYIVGLYIASGSLATWGRSGLRNSAPYFLTAAAAAVLAIVIRREFALAITSNREVLALVSCHDGTGDLWRHVLQGVTRIHRALHA